MFVAEDLSLGYRRVDAKTKEAEQIPTISVDYGFCGQPDDRPHDTLPVLSRARSQKQRHLESSGAVEGCGVPVSSKGSHGRP